MEGLELDDANKNKLIAHLLQTVHGVNTHTVGEIIEGVHIENHRNNYNILEKILKILQTLQKKVVKVNEEEEVDKWEMGDFPITEKELKDVKKEWKKAEEDITQLVGEITDPQLCHAVISLQDTWDNMQLDIESGEYKTGDFTTQWTLVSQDKKSIADTLLDDPEVLKVGDKYVHYNGVSSIASYHNPVWGLNNNDKVLHKKALCLCSATSSNVCCAGDLKCVIPINTVRYVKPHVDPEVDGIEEGRPTVMYSRGVHNHWFRDEIRFIELLMRKYGSLYVSKSVKSIGEGVRGKSMHKQRCDVPRTRRPRRPRHGRRPYHGRTRRRPRHGRRPHHGRARTRRGRRPHHDRTRRGRA